MDLSIDEQKILFEDFFCLGQVPYYDEKLKTISFSETSGRRFLLDFSAIKKRGKDKTLIARNKFNPNYLAFGLLDSLSIIIQKDYNLYKKLYDFFIEADLIASSYIKSCSQSMAIISHNSFGERLFPHIHQDDSRQLPTVSFFLKLTNNTEELPSLILYEKLKKDSKFLNYGYTDHKLLLLHERNSSQENVIINNNDMIVFYAHEIPHSFTYTDDIWITLVYDQAEIADNVKLEQKDRYNVCSITP